MPISDLPATRSGDFALNSHPFLKKDIAMRFSKIECVVYTAAAGAIGALLLAVPGCGQPPPPSDRPVVALASLPAAQDGVAADAESIRPFRVAIPEEALV